MGIEPVVENILDHRAGGIDHRAGLVGGECQQRHVEPFELGRVGDGIIGHGHADIIDTLPQQAEHVAHAEIHLVMGGEADADRAVRGGGQRLGPERGLVLLVERQARPAAHDRKLLHSERGGEDGGGGDNRGEFHGSFSLSVWCRYCVGIPSVPRGYAACGASTGTSASSGMSVMSMWPGLWVMQSGGAAASIATFGVTPQAQNTGTCPSGTGAGSPQSGRAMSAMPISAGSPACTGAPCASG